MNKEGNTLVEEYKGLNDQSNNPTLTAEAKVKAQTEARKKTRGYPDQAARSSGLYPEHPQFAQPASQYLSQPHA